MDSDPVRASELGTYQYCHRAWWYAKQGLQGGNEKTLAAGSSWHNDQARRVWSAGCLRTWGYIALAAALILLVIYLTGLLIG